MKTWNPLQPLKKRLRRTRGTGRPIRPKTLLEVFNTCYSCKEVVPMDAPFTRWNDRMYCGRCGVKEV
jgi:ribosomal protein S27AE